MTNVDTGLNVWPMTSNHNRMIEVQADRSPARDGPVEIAFYVSVTTHMEPFAGAVGERIYPPLLEEHDRTVSWIRQIKGTDTLLADDPVLQRNIALRNPYVDPMSLVQVDFLRRWRAGGREDEELLRVLMTTVRGIARGMQNTG